MILLFIFRLPWTRRSIVHDPIRCSGSLSFNIQGALATFCFSHIFVIVLNKNVKNKDEIPFMTFFMPVYWYLIGVVIFLGLKKKRIRLLIKILGTRL